MRSVDGRPPTSLTPGDRAARHLFLAALGALPVAAMVSALLAGPVAAPLAAAVAVAILTGVTALATQALHGGYPHARLGACNRITLARAAMAAALGGLVLAPGALADPGRAWAVLALAALALALDGVDGIAARRSGLASSFGARFDMEVDALLALILALLALGAGKAGPWILALGAMRYAFVAAMRIWPWLDAPLPDSFRRKTVCVIQIGVLIALLAPVVQPPLSAGIAAAATVLLAWSFATDILWLRRRRG